MPITYEGCFTRYTLRPSKEVKRQTIWDVLAYQFASGLNAALRSKVAEVEGTFDELLVKARFEEAKFRDLSITSVSSRITRVAGRMNSQSNVELNRRPVRAPLNPISIKRDKKEVNFRCFTCNGVGHYRKDCPLKNRSAPVEARGQQLLVIPQLVRLPLLYRRQVRLIVQQEKLRNE